MSQVDHPNIARYHQAWIEGGVPPFLDDLVSSLEKSYGSSDSYEEKAENCSGSSDSPEEKADGSIENGSGSSDEEKADKGSGSSDSLEEKAHVSIENGSGSSDEENADGSLVKGSGSSHSDEEKVDGSTEKGSGSSYSNEEKVDGSIVEGSGSSTSYEEKTSRILYIAMKRYPYSLKEKIGNLSKESIEKIFQGLLSALIHLNNLSIVHGDIKPENILLDEEYNPKLADFGSSFVVGGIVKEGGTTGYLRDGENPTYAMDLYAFGLTMLQVISSLPVLGSEMEALLKKIKNGEETPELMDADYTVKMTVFRILKEPTNISELSGSVLDMEASESGNIFLGLLEPTSEDLC
ncbi:hypothetical protein OROGR_022344 [Orobanche gracilis]